MENGLVYCYDFSLLVWIFRGLAFVRPSLQRIFLTADFTAKELIQTPIEKTAQEKIRRSIAGEKERGLRWCKTTFHRWQNNCPTLCEERKILGSDCTLYVSAVAAELGVSPLPSPPPPRANGGGGDRNVLYLCCLKPLRNRWMGVWKKNSLLQALKFS
jgi:hypothetical protein